MGDLVPIRITIQDMGLHDGLDLLKVPVVTKMDEQFGTTCQLSRPTLVERLQHPARKHESIAFRCLTNQGFAAILSTLDISNVDSS
jgi:hypothetical protein